MKQKELWKDNRWLWDERRKKYRPNPRVVYGGSMHIAQLQVDAYYPLIRQHMRGLLLDCGCDVVPYYAMYRDLVTDNICIDYENTRQHNPWVDRFVNLNERLPFEDNTFDSILMTDVLAHITKPEQLFNEFARILKPGGKVLVTSAFNCWFGEPPYEYYRISGWMQRILCAQAGLEVIFLEPYGGHADVMLDTLNKAMCTRWSYRFFRVIRFVVIHTGWYKRNRARTSERYPIGYSLVAQKKSLD